MSDQNPYGKRAIAVAIIVALIGAGATITAAFISRQPGYDTGGDQREINMEQQPSEEFDYGFDAGVTSSEVPYAPAQVTPSVEQALPSRTSTTTTAATTESFITIRPITTAVTTTTRVSTVVSNIIGGYGRKVNLQDAWNLSLDIGIQAHYPEIINNLTVFITRNDGGIYDMLYQNPTNSVIGYYQLNNGQYTLLLVYTYAGTTSTARIPISISNTPLEIEIYMSNLEAKDRNNAKLVEYLLINSGRWYTAS